MTQPSFSFDPPPQRLVYRGASATAITCSRAAAILAQGGAVSQRLRVLSYWRACGERGASDPEVSAATGVSRQSLCLRRRELMLEDPPTVLDSGRTYMHRSGKKATPCTVWVAATQSHTEAG